MRHRTISALRPVLAVRSLSVLALAVLTGACGREEAPPGPAPTPGAPTRPAAVTVADTGPISGVHAVRCGCAIDTVGRCGNYVDVDGHPLPLQGDLGLGKMEFCGRDGLQATVEGSVADGAFVATSFELVE